MPPVEPRPRSRTQRLLERVAVVGGVLVVIGLVAAAVIVGLYLAGRATPGTWAYAVVMLAPLGFGLILVALLAVSIGRRRDGRSRAD